ncbi:MAG: hypothetical protein CL840_05365 [Crocinitomicaceae bacterium]|nr:hypothetical protein [Crocinitomicaceae bacterium]|tara:strand:+ start:15296 stop:15733 length:438 start_codon:yes stop_codon:yes gene_type:complete
MRIWSLHPKYLDSKGLVALWRETLLAKHVLSGKTKGYRNHPQLNRFKVQENSVDCINQYLSSVYDEAIQRGYNFNKSKIDFDFTPVHMKVTSGQMEFETRHLMAKLDSRDKKRYQSLQAVSEFQPHPMFTIVGGEVADWEIVSNA